MQINITDFLTNEEQKEIVKEAFRLYCEEKFQTDYERIFTNSAYEIVWKLVNEIHDGNVETIIAQKVKELIAELGAFTVFGSKTIYEKEDSEGRKAINRAIKDNRGAIEKAVLKAVSEIGKDDVLEVIVENGFNIEVTTK